MVLTTISCVSIAITGAMLGASVGLVIYAILNAAARADESEWQWPKVEAVLAWARLHGEIEAVEAAIREYENATGREMYLAGERMPVAKKDGRLGGRVYDWSEVRKAAGCVGRSTMFC